MGPGAGVGAAYTSGAVPRYAAYDAKALTGLLSRCRVTLVDVGSLRDPMDLPEDEVATEPGTRGPGHRDRPADR